MTPRDIWKEPPSGSEGDAAKDFERSPQEAPETPDAAEQKGGAEQESAAEQEVEQEVEDEARDEQPRGYEPKHRAPGRAPLIRRRRMRSGDDETVSWETSWSEPAEEASPSRWTDEEEPSITPPARPIEEVPYLGPRRSELRKRRGKPVGDPPDADAPQRSREYTGRHLAPKKPRWSRERDEDELEFEGRDATGAVAEGDVERDEDIQETEGASRAQQTATERDAEAAPADEVAALVPVDEPTEEPAASQAPSGSPDDDPAAPQVPSAEPSEGPAAPVAPVVPAALATPQRPVADPAGQEETLGRSDETASQVSVAGGAAGTTARDTVETEAPSAGDEVEAHDDHAPDDEALSSDDEDFEDDEAPAGPRRAALEERKKKKRVLQGAVAALAVIAAIAGVVGAGLLVKEAVEDPEQRAAVPFDRPEEDVVAGTTLLFGTKEKADPARGAIWMLLLSVDPETEEASVVYVPAHTAVEVPGRGLQGVGEAYGSGGVPLLLVSAENLLGINIDRYVELSDKDALVLFEQFETLTVDVPAEVRVPAGRDQARLIFVEGPQEMTPESLVRLLYTMGIDGDDVELGSRHLAFWDQLLDVYDDGAELAEAFLAAGGALGESDATIKEHAAFMELLAATPSEDVTITALPVRPISAGDAQLYSADAEELTAFIEETIGTPEGGEQEVRVQLLNGNGVPGIGREAAAKLVGEGFRVILGGNARRLNYRETLVVSYDSSDEGIALAERARDLLGVGEVQVSAQQQGIVDLTIVVGKDFLRAR